MSGQRAEVILIDRDAPISEQIEFLASELTSKKPSKSLVSVAPRAILITHSFATLQQASERESFSRL